MTDELKNSGWLDFGFELGDNNAAAFNGDYVAYLNSLDDDDFLMTYNRVREAELNLD
jgi:hypothetical protein